MTGIDLWIFNEKLEAPNTGPMPQVKKHNIAVCVLVPPFISARKTLLMDVKCFHKKCGHIIQSTSSQRCKGGDGGLAGDSRTRC